MSFVPFKNVSSTQSKVVSDFNPRNLQSCLDFAVKITFLVQKCFQDTTQRQIIISLKLHSLKHTIDNRMRHWFRRGTVDQQFMITKCLFRKLLPIAFRFEGTQGTFF